MINKLLSIAALSILPAFTPVHAAEYPTHPVKLLVPYPAGQATDIVARLIAAELTKLWGQAVFVENKGGGAAIPGMMAVRSAKPDGYTIAMGSSAAMAINPGLFQNLSYDVDNDFVLITPLFRVPLVIVANSKTPYNTLKDVVEAAKKSPGTINVSYPGIGTTQHLTGENFKHMAKVDLADVMYKGSGQAVNDLLANTVPLAVESISATNPYIKSGDLKPIATTGVKRAPQLPNVPTVAESGYPGFSGEGWGGLIAPKGTSRTIVDKVAQDIRKIMARADMQAILVNNGLTVDQVAVDEWGRFIAAERVKWGEIIRRADVKPN